MIFLAKIDELINNRNSNTKIIIGPLFTLEMDKKDTYIKKFHLLKNLLHQMQLSNIKKYFMNMKIQAIYLSTHQELSKKKHSNIKRKLIKNMIVYVFQKKKS